MHAFDIRQPLVSICILLFFYFTDHNYSNTNTKLLSLPGVYLLHKAVNLTPYDNSRINLLANHAEHLPCTCMLQYIGLPLRNTPGG